MLDAFREMSDTCYMISGNPLKILLVYICVSKGERSETYAGRFIDTFKEFPPGHPCDMIVVCNGGHIPSRLTNKFNDFSAGFKWGKISYLYRDNDPGWDISAYQEVASSVGVGSDMLVCMGESVYFHRAGWLERIASAWRDNGPGMYGVFASHSPIAHLGTTFFACPTLYMTNYPHVKNHVERYEFEHGKFALWRRVILSGFPATLVTWDGEWGPGRWREPTNCYWRGDQSNCLCFCNHTDRYSNQSDIKTKASWSSAADAPFK
jgi:hypothetical protein